MSPPEPAVSPLLPMLSSAGGKVSEDGSMVLEFGDRLAEEAAVRTRAAVFDLSRRTQIEVRGEDRSRFLNNFCTNDLSRVSAGKGCEAFVTNVKGRVLGHIFLFPGESALWIETVAGAAESLIAHLDRYIITEEVELSDRTTQCGELFVTGPRSLDYLSGCGFSVPKNRYDHLPLQTVDSGWIRRVDWLGAPGYLLAVPDSELVELWERLRQAGVQPAGRETFEVERIRNGFPLYGIDITEDNLAQEVARTEEAISFTKGCYLGQEPIARIDALGHVNRELRVLHLEGAHEIDAGEPVFVAGEDQPIGQVCSAGRSVSDNRTYAFAYLRSKWLAPGTVLDVGTARSGPPAIVAPAE